MHYTTTYQELTRQQPFSLRQTLRTIALSAIAARDLFSPEKRSLLQKNRVQFLYLHHTFSDELPAFAKLLDALAQHHTFLSYSQAVHSILQGQITQPSIAFSFDDGFKNNLGAGKLLHERGISACFFINPNSIELNDGEQIKHFCRTQLDMPPIEFMNWNEVESLQTLGHEIGAHTLHHINIAKTPHHQVQEEIQQNHAILLQRCGEAKHFAFPYGRFFHFTPQAYQTVLQTGFLSCASAERGCHIALPHQTIPPRRLLLRRDHILPQWPLSHIFHFLLQNARNAKVSNNYSHYPSIP